MPLFDPQDLAKWSGGTWSRLPEDEIRSIGHDTRHLQAGSLYIAMVGERVDGHDYFEQAKASGAVAAICLKGRSQELLPCLEVEDPAQALIEVAKGYRSLLRPQHMIGVTGSAGKTTVKDLLFAMLSAAGNTRCTRGNWNNFVGLPLSLLAMESTDRFGIFELGMNRPGEIAGLTEILKPEMGLITSIGEAHLEQLGSVQAIAEEKTSLLAALPADGLAVLDQDSPFYEYVRSRCASRYVRVSVTGESEYEGSMVENGVKVLDRVRGESLTLALPAPGEHMVKNLLQAVAVARECGLSMKQISEGLEKYAPAPMRWQQVQTGKWMFINDAYNANPLSMRKSIRTFSELKHPGEKWLVLGGMAELGASERELHWVIGKELDLFGFDGVILVGEKGSWIEKGVSNTPVYPAGDTAEGAREITLRVPADAWILLKGSRSEQLEKVLHEIQKNEDDPA